MINDNNNNNNDNNSNNDHNNKQYNDNNNNNNDSVELILVQSIYRLQASTEDAEDPKLQLPLAPGLPT